jgi:ribosomal protein L29
MKTKDKQLLQTKTPAELTKDLDAARSDLSKAKLDLKTNQLKDTSQIKKLKHQIAVLKTVIHQKAQSASARKPAK